MSKPNNVNNLVKLLWGFKRLMRDNAQKNFHINPITILRLDTLRFIYENKLPTMKDISEYHTITPPSATSLINPLVKSKQIERIQDNGDRRIVRLQLTPLGKQTLQNGFTAMNNHMKKVFRNLNDYEIHQLTIIFEKLLNIYKK